MAGMTMGPEWAAVLTTVLFSVTGAFCALRSVAGLSVVDRLHNVAHLLMSGTMALMPWPAGTALPAPLVVAVFTVAALFYVGLLLFRDRAAAIDPAQHHASPALLVYHALMMAAMVWMAVAMTPVAGGAQHSHMSGMHMSDASEAGRSTMAMTGAFPWAIGVSVGWGALFSGAAVWLLVRLIRQAVAVDRVDRRSALALSDAVAATLMAAGMALAFLLLMI